MIEVLLVLMLVLAVIALWVPDLLVSVILLSVFSLLSCLFFFVLGAPDVALTEAAVGTGIGTVVFIWTVYKTRDGGGGTEGAGRSVGLGSGSGSGAGSGDGQTAR
ncbi:MAG: hydrogenase subunit MbhD domain-containing protein [Alkalispirochaeta sp.]|jgi:uncharacterized MnhB-related membrane protein